MSEIINWLRSRNDNSEVVFIYSYGGHTMNWEDPDNIDAAESGEGADSVDALGWKKTGNIIKTESKQDWMDAILETFKDREYEPYEWKSTTHPRDSNIQIDYLLDNDGDTWFGIFTYTKGKLADEDWTKGLMMDKLEQAFPIT